MVKQGFAARDEEDTRDTNSNSTDFSQKTSCHSTIWSKIQQVSLPNSLVGLLLITVAVTIFGISNHSNSGISEDTLMHAAGDWDVSPYRFDFLVQSPYNQSASPYYRIFMPLYVTHPLSEPHPEVTSVVISIHGYTRNAELYFKAAVEAVQADPHVLVILPYFSKDKIFGSQWGTKFHGYNSASLHWNTSGWMKGSNASPIPYRFSSSFDIMDDLLKYLSNTELFPSLSLITMAGYSAGSQYASHYAWATHYNITESNPNIHIRYLLSGSSSFLYFTRHRPDISCIENYQLGLQNDCQIFEIPSGDYANTCPEFDHWKYGVSSFPTEGYNYLQSFVENYEAVEHQTLLFRKKDIRYIIGDHDTCNCNTEGYLNEEYCYDIIDAPRAIGSDDGNTDDDDGFIPPSPSPTFFPSEAPTTSPSVTPSTNPTFLPSTPVPTSHFPTLSPTSTPSVHPSSFPTSLPSSLAKEGENVFSSSPNDVVCSPVHSSHESCCDTYPDAFHNLLSLACAANFQGSNRLQRALLYLQYLKMIWKDANYTPPVEIVYGMGHDRIKFFESKTFQDLVYVRNFERKSSGLD